MAAEATRYKKQTFTGPDSGPVKVLRGRMSLKTQGQRKPSSCHGSPPVLSQLHSTLVVWQILLAVKPWKVSGPPLCLSDSRNALSRNKKLAPVVAGGGRGWEEGMTSARNPSLIRGIMPQHASVMNNKSSPDCNVERSTSADMQSQCFILNLAASAANIVSPLWQRVVWTLNMYEAVENIWLETNTQKLRINVVCKTSWHAIARLRIRKHQEYDNIGMYEKCWKYWNVEAVSNATFPFRLTGKMLANDVNSSRPTKVSPRI